jgi:hypothetical protein
MKKEKRMNRRDFFKTAGRYLGFGALGFLGLRALLGGLESRRKGASNAGDGTSGLPDQTCRSDWICAKCGYVPGCGLPQALSYRRETPGS